VSDQVVATRSRDEIESAILAFTPADWARLTKAAHYFALGRPIEAEDLLQEAFLRALDDGRHCPVDVDVVWFLKQAMRSIAHGELEKVAGHPAVASADSEKYQAAVLNYPDPWPSPENEVVDGQNDAAFRLAILALFEDDPVARDAVEGIMEGLKGAELREMLCLDETAYATKRKLIRRRVDKAYPRGWKP
jgi:DNA-directed RNA polymerase specialized sigma24 family protein